jgi:uncharacterized protein (DUF697 family)
MAGDVAAATSDSSKEAQCSAIIKRFATYSAVAGLIPLPVVDAVVLTGVQVKMIAALAEVYGLPFNRDAVKGYAAAIVGGVLPVSPIGGAAIHAVRFVPLIGPILGIAVVPAFASALTWAVGRVFASHFETGNDLFNLDIGGMKDKVKRNLSHSGNEPATAPA